MQGCVMARGSITLGLAPFWLQKRVMESPVFATLPVRGRSLLDSDCQRQEQTNRGRNAIRIVIPDTNGVPVVLAWNFNRF